MATMFCSDCRADLDTVPVGAPCPACGGRGRSATIKALALVARSEISALVKEALAEVAAMPEEKLREIVGGIVHLGVTIRGSTALSGEPTVIQVTAGGHGVSDGSATVTVERSATGMVLITDSAPAFKRLIDALSPKARWLLLLFVAEAIKKVAYGPALDFAIRKVAALLAAAHVNNAQPVDIDVSVQPPAVEQHEPVPPQAAPPLGPFADHTKT
jgi:hypothetical protein